MAEHILVPLFSGSQHNQLDIVLAHLVQDTLDQIEALLVSQPGNNTNHKLPVILRQSQFFLQRPFVLYLLLTEILSIVLLDNVRIRLRIEIIVINAVHNAAQAVRARPHQAIQSFAVKWHLNLFRIRLTYGGNGVGVYNAAL